MAARRVVEEIDDGWRMPDALWEQIVPFLPPEPPHPRGGRPWTDARAMMDGIFYVGRTGCQWKALPRCFGAPSTVHDRYQCWCEAGVFARLWQAGLLAFDEAVGIDWEWQALDGVMTKAPLGGEKDGSQSHRPREIGHQTVAADGGAWHPDWPRRRWRQSHRHEVGGIDAGVDAHRPTGADRGSATAPLYGPGV